MKEVEIKQSHLNQISIPSPGELRLTKSSEGFGSVYLEDGKKLIWVVNLNPETIDEAIYLQPGNYRAEFRSKFNLDSDASTERRFTIISEKQTFIKL